MNLIKLIAFLIIACPIAHAQTILFPPKNVILYTGDKITINWKTRGFGNSVWIHIYSPVWRSGMTVFIAAAHPDNGEFEWTVSKGLLTETNMVLTVFYSGISGEENLADEIPVVILPGPRPDNIPVPVVKPVGVPISIRKVVSVEWVANTNHVYQIRASTDLKNWEIVAEGKPEETNAMLLFYQDQAQYFFKVEDCTPLRP